MTEEIYAGRHLGPIHLFQVRLDLAHRHAARIQQQDLIVETGPTGLMLGNQLRLEVAVAITRISIGSSPKFALERLEAALRVLPVALAMGSCLS